MLLSDQEENAEVGSVQELWGELANSLEHSNWLTVAHRKAVRSHQKLGLLMKIILTLST